MTFSAQVPIEVPRSEQPPPRTTVLSSRLIQSLKWNAIVRAFEIALRLLSSLVIARGLGVRLYGMNASVNSLLTLLPIGLSMGLEQTIQVLVPRWIASAADRYRVRNLVRSLAAGRFAIYGSAGIVLYFGAPAIAEWVREPEVELYLRLAAPAMIISGLAAIYANVAQARLQIRGLSVYGMMMQVVGLMAAFFILRAGWGIVGLLGWSIVAAGISLGFFALNADGMLPPARDRFEVRPVLRFAVVAWLTAVFGQILQKEIDVLALNVFHVPWEAIAAYSLGASLGMTLGSLSNGTGPLFQGALAEAAQRFDRRRVGDVWQLAIKTAAVLWVPPLFFVLCFAPEIVMKIYGREFRDAAWVFQMIALPQLGAAMLGESFSGALFFALGRQRLALLFRVVAGGLNVVLDLVLIPRFGVIGAIAATSVALVGVAAAEAIMVRRLTGVVPPIPFLAKWLGAFAFAGVGAMLVPDLGWWAWGVRLAVYAVLAVGLLRIVRPLEAEERELLTRHMPIGRWVFANL